MVHFSHPRKAGVVCLLPLILLSYVAMAADIIPAPIVVSPSQYWEGNDGPWSTFTVQVGTPAQNVRVLISTAGSATWVVVPEGCPDGGVFDCTDLRGQSFNLNASSTWKFNDYYELVLESNLDYAGTGGFGFDKVGIGWQGDGGPVLENQVVAGIAIEDFWLGSFGLTPRPTNFSNFNDPQPSFVETLKNKSMIPSLSWSYTAGAPYRLDKVLGSLVLGGYDASKAGTSNMTFDFAPDISRDLSVGLQAITVEVDERTVGLLPEGMFTFIDSTVPHIWLPQAACERFEEIFHLTWNATVGLYLLNETHHQSLLAANTNFTFTIGNDTHNPPTIDITLPYASFDLSVDYPIVSNRTRYFPIVRAANETQYTLGRVFLQEAYLTVDYERSQFYLSQTQFNPDAEQLIIAIPSTNSSTTESEPKKTTSTAFKAGIAVGSIGAVAIVAALLFYLIRRKRRIRGEQQPQPPPAYPVIEPEGFHKAELDAGDTSKPGHEIGGTAVEFFQPDKPDDQSELPESSVASPASTSVIPDREPIYEMLGDHPTPQELAGTNESSKNV